MKKLIVVIFISLAYLNCSKPQKHDNGTGTNSKDTILYYPTSPNNALRAIYKQENGLITYFYGEKDGSDNISKIQSAIIKKDISDSAINLIYDDSGRVSQMYATVGNVKDSIVAYLSYRGDSTDVLFYSVDWITNNSFVLKARATLKDTSVSNSELYKKMRGDDEKIIIGSTMAGMALWKFIYGAQATIGTAFRGGIVGAACAIAFLIPKNAFASQEPVFIAGPQMPAGTNMVTLLTNNSSKTWTGNWDYDGCLGNIVSITLRSDFSYSVSSTMNPCTAADTFTNNFPKFILKSGILYLPGSDFLSSDDINNYPHTIVKINQHELVLNFYYTGAAGPTVTLHD